MQRQRKLSTDANGVSSHQKICFDSTQGVYSRRQSPWISRPIEWATPTLSPRRQGQSVGSVQAA